MIRVSQRQGECYIIGTSVDVKPTPTLGYTFIETDSAKFYVANGSAWIPKFNSSYIIPVGGLSLTTNTTNPSILYNYGTWIEVNSNIVIPLSTVHVWKRTA